MVAIESAAMIDWLSPTTMVDLAMGSWTLVSRCQRLCPEESVASMVVAETFLIP